MKVQEYIEQGTVLDYCLGMLQGEERDAFERDMYLYPELREEVDAIQNGLDKYVSTYKESPVSALKDKIWSTLENIMLEGPMDLNNLPLLNKYTDTNAWMKAVRPLLPETVGQETFMHVLTQTEKVFQVLIMSGLDIPDEVHEDVVESFIILEGECECYIGDRMVRMKAGEFIEIPLHEHHDVKIVSDYVIGVMQRIAA